MCLYKGEYSYCNNGQRVTQLRRLIEQYLIWFKMDLKISEKCAMARANLRLSLAEPFLFAKEFTDYFKDPVQLPYKVLMSDPSQVVILKKIINALYNVEIAFQTIEHLDAREERYTLGILRTIIPTSYQAVHELYTAIQLLNTSNEPIQRVVGPHLHVLLSALSHLSSSLQRFRPNHPEEDLAKLLATGVGNLPINTPSTSQSLNQMSTVIFSLPQYFEKLEQLITPMPEQLVPGADIKAYKQHMQKKISQLTSSFEALLSRPGVLMLPSYVSIIYQLVQQSSEIVSAATPLTQNTYQKMKAILNRIRHTLLPSLIAEVEHIEDSLCLKPETLTGPLLIQMNDYYKKLATYVQYMSGYGERLAMIEQTGVVRTGIQFVLDGQLPPTEIDSEALNLVVMRDDGFEDCLRLKNMARLLEAEFEQNDPNKLIAVESFARKIRSLWGVCLAHASASVKAELLLSYKVFQSDFATLYPHLDNIIVEALNTVATPGIVKTLGYGFASTLTRSSELQQISVCLNSFMSVLSQSKSAAQLQVQLITQRADAQERRFQESRRHNALFLDSEESFVPLLVCHDDASTSSMYRQKRVAIGVQLRQIDEAEQGLNEFFIQFAKLQQHDAVAMENLCLSYRKIQPFILFLEKKGDLEKGFNEQWVCALRAGTMKTLNEQPMRLTVASCLASQRSSLIRENRWYAQEEQRAQQRELQEKPLSTMANEQQSHTLFGQISTLHLSSKVADFMQKQLMPFLKQSLDPDIFQALAIDKLPYVNLYQDSPEVILYKKLINTLYHLQQSLTQMEELHRKGDPSSTKARGQYVWDVMVPVMTAIYYANYYIDEALRNPGIRIVINEALEIIRPLHNVPLLSNYLDNLPKPMANIYDFDVDMVALWKEQQKLAALSLSGKPYITEAVPTPEEEHEMPVDTAPTSTSHRDTVQKIAELLYKIPNNLRNINNGERPSNTITDEQQQQIQAFVSSLFDGSFALNSLFGAQSLRRILETLVQTNQQLSMMGKEAHHLVLNQVENMGAVLIRIVNNMEFQLGLNVGTLTAIFRTHFHAFYTTLINNFPFPDDTEQEKRILLSSTFLTNACIIHERMRHWVLKANQKPQEIALRIFGGPHPSIDKIKALYIKLQTCVDETSGLVSSKQDVLSLYQRLRPYLAIVDPKTFTKDYLNNMTDEMEFLRAIKYIQQYQRKACYPFDKGIFNKFKVLATCCAQQGGFERDKHKILFLNYYQEMQVFLRLIDFRYDQKYFLRNLKTPHDFEVELGRIIGLEEKLRDYVNGCSDTRTNKLARCNRRIAYLTIQQYVENLSSLTKDAAFKQAIFDDYWKNTLEPALHSEIMRSLGYYAPSLFNKIEQTLLEQKNQLLDAISIKNKNIKTVITETMDAAIEAIKVSYASTQTAYVGLNRLLKRVDEAILQQEKQTRSHPLCQEFLQKLYATKSTLERDELRLTNQSPDLLATDVQMAENMLREAAEYDAMIAMYFVLEDMISHVTNETDNLLVNQAKKEELIKLQRILTTTEPTSIRLKAITERGLSKASKRILEKHSDNALKEFFHQFILLLTKFIPCLKPTYEKMYSFFKGKNEELNRGGCHIPCSIFL